MSVGFPRCKWIATCPGWYPPRTVSRILIASTAPDFELEDHAGSKFRLRNSLGPGGTVLVFFRGHWCPYCRRYLGKLQSNLDRFARREVVLVGISPEPPGTSRALAEQMGLRFPLLSDPDGRVIDRYGTRNGFLTGRSVLPHPSVFIIGPGGDLRFKSIDRNYKKRTTMRTIFGVLDEARAGPTDQPA